MDIRMSKTGVYFYKDNEEAFNIDANGKIRKSTTFIDFTVEEIEATIKMWNEWKNPKIPKGWELQSSFANYNSVQVMIYNLPMTHSYILTGVHF